ncbi:hypothetical protein [Rubrivivax albus]|uniref:hypothetical protein n=1 Tax=Rubrivivax albus TaxID=2499835 RepID=UPI001305402B|nr:hypothetical protein [Rubrivivax albus]
MAFVVAFAAILGTPVIAPLASWWLNRQPAALRVRRLRDLCTGLCLFFVALLLGISTPWFELNALLCGIAYITTGVLAVSAFRVRPRLVGIALGSIGVLVLILSMLLGTVGALAVGLIVGDAAPIYTASLPLNRRCFVKSFGNVTTTSGGYDVTIKYVPPFFPLVALWRADRRFANPTFEPPEACLRAINSGA